jgi:hypothetical protein
VLAISRANLFGALGLTTAETSAIKTLEGFLSFAPTGFDDFDVVFDQLTATGVGVDVNNDLMIIHGGTMRALQEATAVAGGTVTTQAPNRSLLLRIQLSRNTSDPQIANATLGKVADLRAAVENLIDALKTGKTTPRPVTPLPVVTARPGPVLTTASATSLTSVKKLTPGAKIAIGTGAVVAVGIITALAIVARR